MNTREIFNTYLTYFDDADNGKVGKAAELTIRHLTSGKTQSRVKAQGKFDAYVTYKSEDGRKSVTLEIKTACGDIATATRSQYIAYCPEVDERISLENQFFVFTREQWTEFVEGYTGRGKFLRLDKAGRLHIQSFRSTSRPKASQPIADYIWNTCYEMPTYCEWLADLRG